MPCTILGNKTLQRVPKEALAPPLPLSRKEVEHWKAETENARVEANEARKRLEDQEENVAGVLHQSAEVSSNIVGLDSIRRRSDA